MIKIGDVCNFKLYTNKKHDNKDKEYKKYFQKYFVISVGCQASNSQEIKFMIIIFKIVI